MTLPVRLSLQSSPHKESVPREREGSAIQGDVQYRPTKEISFELEQHVQIFLEEGLLTQAFDLLLSIVGNSVSALAPLHPVTIPPRSQIAVAATLAVHPTITSRTDSREKQNQANAALRLLRLINTLVGPVNADFASAFSFRKFDFRFTRRSPHRSIGEEGDAGGESDSVDGENEINTPYAHSQSLWTRAEDFWQLVGWAFNCACRPGVHAARWDHYQLLLEFLVDVLEEDWHIRNAAENSSADESLLWQYIELSTGGHARARRILRAIFADGSQRSLNEFREIFPNELKKPEKEHGKIKKREVDVNIYEDVFGDYEAEDDLDMFEDDEDDAASAGTGASGWPRNRLRVRSRTPSSTRVTPKSSAGSLHSAYATDGENSPASRLGGPSCLALRLRLLRLLTYVASHPTLMSTSPTTFPDLDELNILFVEFIRPLSLPVFAQIVLPTPSNPLGPTSLADLCEALLQRLLESSAPSIRSHVLLSKSKLEQEYLPFAAAKDSVDANARVSVLLESLTRCLAQIGNLQRTRSLARAAAIGVKKRLCCVAENKGDGKKRQGDDDLAREWLLESGERLTRVIEKSGAGE
ncbi:hypothetical protein AYL99_07888 [Fonsecaea erecta]|uniref:Uncharacterized protein n=1 Tax=Fonsecaea erecta TaxID=1367422 RepID=A0A178ZCE2_9EURO|nr:hypothetical protein AYL99_07888 [Fonsecaea erecta]OAP57151.1 hypothetical protein AYL99_07888 [Fonsecaea erecta]